MAIIKITTDTAGQINVIPRNVKIITTDNLATVTTAGYLNPTTLEGYTIYQTDIIQMYYSAISNQFGIVSAGTFSIFIVSITNGVITLSQWNGSSNAMLLNSVNNMTSSGSIVANKVNGTEASNAVTTNGMSGIITTSSLSTAGGSNYAITWTNSFISSTSTILLTIQGGTNTTENITFKCVPGNGTATLTIYNNTASTALNGTILIGYLVI